MAKTDATIERDADAGNIDRPETPRCFVYVLGCADSSGPRTYVGWTNDLDARLAKHNAGTGARSTRGRQWSLLYAEPFGARSEAMRREWHLKRDRKFRQALKQSVY